MNDFHIGFCKTPFVYEIYQLISFENSTTGKEDSKTKFYFEKVPIMRLHSAIVFFSNVPFLKFLLIHLLSMKLTPLQQTFIRSWSGFNFPLCSTNGHAELFVEEECRGRLPTRRFQAMTGILRSDQIFNASPLLKY